MATARTEPKASKAREVMDTRRAAALDPHYNWKRALPAHGQRAVDFEERVNSRRLHDYGWRARARRSRSRISARCSASTPTTFAT